MAEISVRDQVVEKIQDLPEPALREVLNFVDFLAWRSIVEEEPLLSVAGTLSGEPLSAEEIETELYGDGALQ